MLIERSDIQNGIVFCNRKTDVDIVAKSLTTHGFDAAPIHGDLDQSLRTKTLSDFRNGALKLLVASDVAARGLDIPAVSHVFNYDVPHHADDYVHRIGRTGRAGRSGEAFMIVTPSDDKALDKVLKLIKKEPVELTLDGVDFTTISDRPRKEEGRSRSRRSTRENAPVEAATALVTETEVSTEAPAGEEKRSRRSRSRRKPESSVQAEHMTPAIESEEVASIASELEYPETVVAAVEFVEKKQTNNRRNKPSDKKKNVAANALETTHSVAFGNEVPAFLRRAVVMPS